MLPVRLIVSALLVGNCFAAPSLGRLWNEVSGRYSHTPSGYVLSHCVHTVEEGSHLKATANGGFSVTHATVPTYTIPKCNRPVVEGLGELPVLVQRNTVQDLPADYNGWLAYTAFNHSVGFNSYVGDFSVPDIPDRVGQIVYLFTGLQNKDWIPKHDPESEGAGFDIIQPVLQYPGDLGHYWSVKSWYVTIDAGAVQSTEKRCKPGDTIFGNMTKVGPTSWFIDSVVQGGVIPEHTSITADHPRLKSQPWAYNVLEGYGLTGCDNYPKQPCKFDNLVLTDTRGQTVTPKWLVNPKPDSHLECHESATVESPGTVTINFQ